MRAVEHHDARGEDHFEHHSCNGHRRRLAQEDAGGVEPRQAQPVVGAVGRLEGEAPLHGEHTGRRARPPRTGPVRPATIGARSGPSAKAKSTSTTHGNGHHLVHDDPRAELDPEVLARHQHGVTPHGHPPGTARSSSAGDRRGARRGARRVAPSTRPPTSETTRSARGHDTSGSWDARSTVAPSATASATISPSSARARRRARRAARRGATAPVGACQEDGQRHPPALAGRQATHRSAPEPAHQARAARGRRRFTVPAPGGPHREAHVLHHVQLVVQGGRVAEHPHLPAERRRVAAQVVTENDGPHQGQRQKAGTAPAARSSCRPRWAPRDTRISPGATVRSMPAKTGNRPVRATAARRGTAEAMGSAHATGGPPESKRAPPRARTPVSQLTVNRPRPTARSASAAAVDNQWRLPVRSKTPKTTRDPPDTTFTSPQAPADTGQHLGQVPEGQPGGEERARRGRASRPPAGPAPRSGWTGWRPAQHATEDGSHTRCPAEGEGHAHDRRGPDAQARGRGGGTGCSRRKCRGVPMPASHTPRTTITTPAPMSKPRARGRAADGRAPRRRRPVP